MPHYAHSLRNELDKSKWETLPEHEAEVAQRCRDFLTRIDESLGDWGKALGKWHDLGKYHPDFQAKLEGESIQIEHACAGAALAASVSPEHGIPIQYVIWPSACFGRSVKRIGDEYIKSEASDGC